MDSNLKHCLFCERERTDELGEELWNSDLVLSPSKTSDDIIFTVCRSCRKKKTIGEIYSKLMDKLLEEEK